MTKKELLERLKDVPDDALIDLEISVFQKLYAVSRNLEYYACTNTVVLVG